jgi:tartrate dehydratase alpha subunit/fumarate hydratase class I-like protein
MGHVSYLAIVVDQQLELWTHENEHASKFVARRAARLPEATCCWIVVTIAVARKIEALMIKGKKAAATRALQSNVVDWGRILPEESTELDAFS